MRRTVWTLVFLGIFGLASGTAIADNYRGGHGGRGYNGPYRPYNQGYYAHPRVVVRPTVVVPSYPVYRNAYPAYQSRYRPGGYSPYNYGPYNYGSYNYGPYNYGNYNYSPYNYGSYNYGPYGYATIQIYPRALSLWFGF